MKPVFRIGFALSLAVSSAAGQKFTKTGPVTDLKAPVTLDTTGMFQAAFASVGEDVFIGGQPTPKALREMKARGVTTVINLRTPEEMKNNVDFDEVGLIKELGMKYVFLPGRGNGEFPYTPEQVTQVANAIAGANGKVLLHCTVAWRASHMWAAYLIEKRGVPVEQALSNARAINLMDEHRMGGNGRQPVEDYLNRVLPTLGHPKPPQDAAAGVTVKPVSNVQQPKRPPTNGGLPAVSPDGKWIAFIRNGDGVTPGLYVIGADGTGERRLADAPNGPPQWLGDGSGIYFSLGKFTDDSSDVRAVKLSGGESTLIERIPARGAVLTPDMKNIYATNGRWPNLGLVHIPLGSHQVHQITKASGAFFNIAIGPDEQLAFAHGDSTMRPQIKTLANGALKFITHIDTVDGSPQWPSWSPDGKWIAVQSGRYNSKDPAANTAHIWMVDAVSGAARKLGAHDKAYLDETPSFFPDGKRIAFQSDRSGRMEIWVMNADGTGARQVTR